MLSPRIAMGIRVGLIAAAATAGVLVGLGVRHQAAFQPFEVTGRSIVAARLGLLALPAVAAVVGALAHAAWMIAWGVLFVTLARGARGRALLLAAAATSVAVWIISAFLLSGAMGAARGAQLGTAQSVLFLVIFAASLAAGVIIARAEPQPPA